MEFFPLTLGTPRPAPGARDEKDAARSYEAWREGLSGPAEQFDERPAAQVLAELMAPPPGPATEAGLMLVLGEPGAGKSSLLAHWHATWLAALPPPRLGLRMPVLVPLRKVEAGMLVGRPEEVADRLWELRGARDRERTPAGAYYELAPRLFSPVWLLDGLDEFPARNLAAPEVWEALAALPGACLLSCRTAVFQQLRHDAEGAVRRIIGAAREQRIVGLKPAEQEGFLRLALAAEHLDPARAPELVRRLNASAPLRPLAANPLLLHLAAVTSADAEVPANRATFYADATYKLWRRTLIGEPERLALATERDRALASLAEAMGLERIEARGAQALLDRAGIAAPLRGDLVRSGLLQLDEARDLLAFPHLTFQEFHLARSLLARPFAEVLAEHWDDPRYEEVLALLMTLHADEGRGAIVGEALRAFVEQARERHAAHPQRLWAKGRSPMRVALHLHGRAAAPGIALPVEPSSEPLLLRVAIAADNRTSPEALRSLSRDRDPKVRRSAAGNKATPAEDLSALSRDRDPKVRRSAAGNTATPAEDLSALSSDQDARVRQEVARNDATPAQAKWALRYEPNHNTPASEITTTIEFVVRVRAAVRKGSTLAAALSALVRKPNAKMRQRAVAHPATMLEDLGHELGAPAKTRHGRPTRQ